MNTKKTQFYLTILMVAMSLATAWAVRGHFGHEQGAAWAGGVGALALVLLSRRTDWYQRVFTITLASAIGWGMGGIISYGRVVGYGRSNDFPNAFYGLLMLFVIGGLFGLMGGGLTGLSLESTKQKKVNWAALIAEMVAGGLIFYAFFVLQLEILMTPPRAENWAFILGAGVAMIWYMARNEYYSSLRVALYTMLGAGFGFAFGNFLQILGNVLNIQFNMWNVMEYSIGFWGGLAMAWSVLTSQWPEIVSASKKWESRTSFWLLFALFPLVVFRESLSLEQMIDRLGDIANVNTLALFSSIFAIAFIVGAIIYVRWQNEKSNFQFTEKNIFTIFAIYLTTYVAVSFISTGALTGKIMSNHILYVVNLLVIFYFQRKITLPVGGELHLKINVGKWAGLLIIIILFIAIIALVAVNIHGELGGAHMRFPID